MVGLYIHIPFCKRKCDYCHFYVTRPSASREQILLEGLKREWESYQALIQDKSLKTVYFGGGTPSQADPETLEEILSWLPPCEETTLEANPDDVSPAYAKTIARLGINRVT